MTNETPAANFFPNLSGLLNWIHLIYLGLLPAGATYALLAGWPRPEWMRPLIFIGGIALVGVYQAVLFSYAGRQQRVWPLLLVIFDGPLFAWLGGGSTLVGAEFAVRAFLIDGLAIWLVIAFLAVSTDRPSPNQRLATLGFVVVAVLTLVVMALPFLRQVIAEGLGSVSWLAAGIVEAIIARYLVLDEDQPPADGRQTPFFIVTMVVAWIVAMIVGSIRGDLAA